METIKICDTELELQNGTMVRFSDGQEPYYLDLGVARNGNRVLFYYANATEIVDYIQTIIDRLPEFAGKYLTGIIENEHDILVRLWTSDGEISNFEIYYDTNCNSNDIMEIINWMELHNDFDAATYRYTQIKNGHQTVCE